MLHLSLNGRWIMKNSTDELHQGVQGTIPGSVYSFLIGAGLMEDPMDSLQKRIGFLEDVCNELELKDVTTVHTRAEDAGRNKKYREKYDIATARAVASLPVLCEYCLPFVKVGGIFLAMKGHAEEELKDAKKAIALLGGTIEKTDEFVLPGTDMNRSVIVIRKVRPTPPQYPRQAGKPSKTPIS